jgi:two-component system OmpR family sensor kinase
LANLAESLNTEEQQQILASMENQTLRLSRLVTGLRKLAELETLPLELSTVEIAHLLDESLTLVQERPEARNRRITLSSSSVPDALPAVTGDRDLLLLAIHNLLDNALKFTNPGDVISLQAAANEEAVIIHVMDTGQGIPDGEIPLVWEELYRGQRVNGTFGSGIGLALVEAIVKRHGGRVSLTSRVGQGTTVMLTLPLNG